MKKFLLRGVGLALLSMNFLVSRVSASAAHEAVWRDPYDGSYYYDSTNYYNSMNQGSQKDRKKYEHILQDYDQRQQYHNDNQYSQYNTYNHQGNYDTTYDSTYDTTYYAPYTTPYNSYRGQYDNYYLASATTTDLNRDVENYGYGNFNTYNIYNQASQTLDKERSQMMQKYILLFGQSNQDPQDLLSSCKSDVLSYLNRRWSTLRQYVAQDQLQSYDDALIQKRRMINAVFNTSMYSDANYNYGQHTNNSSQLLQRLQTVRNDVQRILSRSDTTQDERTFWQAVQVMLDIQHMLLTGPYAQTYAQNYGSTLGYLNMSDPTAVNRLVQRLYQIVYY